MSRSARVGHIRHTLASWACAQCSTCGAAAFDDDHDDSRRLGSLVLDAMRAVCGVQRSGPLGQRRSGLVVEDERYLPLEDVEHFATAFRMKLPVVGVAGLEHPVPEFGLCWLLGADEEVSPAALGTVPEAYRLVAADDPEHWLGPDREHLCEPRSERGCQSTDGGDARIGSALLDLDHHALAHS